MPTAPGDVHVPTHPGPCSAHAEILGIRSMAWPGASSPALPTCAQLGHANETVTAWGQDKGFGGRVRSVALAGLETAGERSTFLHASDWYMENVSTSHKQLSWRKLSKYYFKQTLLFKGLFQTCFIMHVWFPKGQTVSPSPPNAVNQGRPELKND